MDALSGVTSYGLEKSVSQYTFERNLEELGKSLADFVFGCLLLLTATGIGWWMTQTGEQRDGRASVVAAR